MVSTERPTNVKYALMLGRMGYKVLPLCWPNPEGNCGCDKDHDTKVVGKAPMPQSGAKAASAEALKITRLWAGIPKANIGLELTGYVMVDPDSNDAQLEAEELGLPRTLTRLSRFDAYLYKAPQGLPPLRLIHKGESGNLDIMANGYMVAYGTHQTGCQVEFQDLDIEPADAPQWVVDLIWSDPRAMEMVWPMAGYDWSRVLSGGEPGNI